MCVCIVKYLINYHNKQWLYIEIRQEIKIKNLYCYTVHYILSKDTTSLC